MAPSIMVVDDSPTVRKLVQVTLEREGYQVVPQEDGMQALSALRYQLPAVIFLDIAMPQMDGYQVCKLIRHNADSRHLPIIMLSGKDGFFDRMRGRMAGATAYITKPFEPQTLLNTVQQHVPSPAAEDTAAKAYIQNESQETEAGITAANRQGAPEEVPPSPYMPETAARNQAAPTASFDNPATAQGSQSREKTAFEQTSASHSPGHAQPNREQPATADTFQKSQETDKGGRTAAPKQAAAEASNPVASQREKAPSPGNAGQKSPRPPTEPTQTPAAPSPHFMVRCPACNKRYRAKAEFQGRIIHCPNCRTRFRIASQGAKSPVQQDSQE